MREEWNASRLSGDSMPGAIFFGGNVLKNTVFSPLGEVSWGLWISYLLVVLVAWAVLSPSV